MISNAIKILITHLSELTPLPPPGHKQYYPLHDKEEHQSQHGREAFPHILIVFHCGTV